MCFVQSFRDASARTAAGQKSARLLVVPNPGVIEINARNAPSLVLRCDTAQEADYWAEDFKGCPTQPSTPRGATTPRVGGSTVGTPRVERTSATAQPRQSWATSQDCLHGQLEGPWMRPAASSAAVIDRRKVPARAQGCGSSECSKSRTTMEVMGLLGIRAFYGMLCILVTVPAC
eukprot:s3706_g3.t1